MLGPTLPEPESDLLAQIACLLDPRHPKDAVFLALGNDLVMVRRPDGLLVTTHAGKAVLFARPALDDDGMAAILEYPQVKSEVAASPDPVAVQVRNAAGQVITEAAASLARVQDSILALAPHVPGGGSIVILSIDAALARRLRLNRAEGA
jgi:hypothetical protein